jgi:hypothetical protein
MMRSAWSTVSLVHALRQAGGNPIYTEFASGSPNSHLYGIGTGASNPVFVNWLLAQRRGVASTLEPLLSITAPTPQDRSRNERNQPQSLRVRRGLGSRGHPGRLDELRQQCVRCRFGHERLERGEHPAGRWQTNVVVVVGTTTSWAPFFGGNTTFNAALTVIQTPIRATLTLQGPDALLSWTGGEPPYRVQRATDISSGDWTDALIEAVPPVTLTLERRAEFYRIVGQ